MAYFHNTHSAYDSGSPIIIPGNSAKEDILVALVSWGEECADPVFAGVNSRISDALDWIDETVCNMSDNPPDDFHCFGNTETSGGDEGNEEKHPLERFGHIIMFALLSAISAVIIMIIRGSNDSSLLGKKGWYSFRRTRTTTNTDDVTLPVEFSEKSKLYPSSPALTAETRSDSFYSVGTTSYDSINNDLNRQNSFSP